MRRILLWAMSTLSAVVLLFSYKTSTSSSSLAVQPEMSSIAPIVGGSAPATGSSSASTTSSPTPGSTSSTPSFTSSAVDSTSSQTDPTEDTAGSTDSSDGTAAAVGATTITGSVAQTRWGPVQVQLTVDAGRITQVSVLQYPEGNDKDQQINARALPVLIQETISAQSSDIDMVSGATVTSQGYLTSLQSALDQAG